VLEDRWDAAKADEDGGEVDGCDDIATYRTIVTEERKLCKICLLKVINSEK
jgi:hypothetical protein